METVFEELKRYVGFDAEDAALLATFRDAASPHFERIAQEFYDRIREHEDAHAVFTGEEQIQRLQRSLIEWMRRLLSGVYDETYFERSAIIGRVHVKVGLPQRYVFSAMALIRVAFTRIAEESLGPKATRTCEALTRLLDIDLAIMLESYRENLFARIERTDRLEREEIARTMARAEHIYAHTLENMPMLIVGLDLEGKVRLFNREIERITGFARDEVLGLPFVETLLPGESAGDIQLAFSDRSSKAIVVEHALRTRAGNLREVKWILTRVGVSEQDIVLFAIGRDVTDELIAAERAQQQERLAAVGTLAAGLAHEIRNPLNGAQLHVTFLERSLKKTDANHEMLEAVTVIGDEIKRLANLVTEFLDSAHPKPLVLQLLKFRNTCDRIAQLVTRQATEAHATLVWDLPAQDLVFMADGPKLEQVILNLMQNAIDAVGAGGGGTVTLRARRTPRHVVIDVEDTGPGFTSSDAPIFDAFYSTKPDGTGLGLAIVHRIVLDHGGTIDAESKLGFTRFRITLPFRDGRESAKTEDVRS